MTFRPMPIRFAALLLPMAALSLSACASDGYATAGYYSGHYPNRAIWYDGYYDNFLGPVYGGYWGPGDVFLYPSHRGAPYVVDRGHRFRHGWSGGSHRFHYRDHRGH